MIATTNQRTDLEVCPTGWGRGNLGQTGGLGRAGLEVEINGGIEDSV